MGCLPPAPERAALHDKFDSSFIMIRKSAILLFLTVCLCSAASCGGRKDTLTDGPRPAIRGSFIQPYLFEDWDDARWQTEFDNLRHAGMDFIIFMHTVHADVDDAPQAVYPTALPGIRPGRKDLLEDCLRNAEKAGFKVFAGLNFDERWWSLGTGPVDWLIESLQQGNDIAAEIAERYKSRYPETLHGWYWVWEVEPSVCSEQPARELLVQALNINLDCLRKITPEMPVLISPFMNSLSGSSDNCMEVWKYVLEHARFKDGDIFAPQDCVGSGYLDIGEVEEWFGKLASIIPDEPEIRFWGNVEMFDQRFWTSADVDRVVRQMELIRPFVSGYISFAYSHYYSPEEKNPAIHEAYCSYVESGKMPRLKTPPAVKGLRADSREKILTWNALTEKNLMGYRIYRDGELAADLQLDRDGLCPCRWRYTGVGCTYEVSAYDVWGNESEKETVYAE